MVVVPYYSSLEISAVSPSGVGGEAVHAAAARNNAASGGAVKRSHSGIFEEEDNGLLRQWRRRGLRRVTVEHSKMGGGERRT